MSERAKYMGRRAEASLRAGELRVKIAGLVRSLRDNLDPTEAVEKLPGEIIAQQAVELSAAQIELRGVLDQISKIDEILG